MTLELLIGVLIGLHVLSIALPYAREVQALRKPLISDDGVSRFLAAAPALIDLCKPSPPRAPWAGEPRAVAATGSVFSDAAGEILDNIPLCNNPGCQTCDWVRDVRAARAPKEPSA